MARKPMAVSVIEHYEPPSPTKEDAAEPEYGPAPVSRSFNTGHAHGRIYPDGHDAGHETPAEIEIDRMLYPHAESNREREDREYRAKRDGQIQSFKDEAFQRSRQFKITGGNPTGENPGPPSLFDDD